MTAASTESTSDSRCFKRFTGTSCDMTGGGWMEGASSSNDLEMSGC